MEPDDFIEDRDDIPNYRDPEEIDAGALSLALGTLRLLGDDPYLRIQAFNLSLVDQFIMRIERQLRQRRFDEEKLPFTEIGFLSAQTQMWIFASYEILRTWRERAKDVVKLARNGGLALKADALDKKLPYFHPGREARASELRRIIEEPSLIDGITLDIRRTHILFSQLEHVRIALAKHEVSGKKKLVAYAPGLASFNRWNGSLEYEISREGAIMGTLNRRDIADSLRALSDGNDPSSDQELESFDKFIKGPPSDLWE
ncbi:MAG: hypothetical protein JWL84_5185 [Rhodospirillales bacterium]|nr:hypothetical protein [Rhodospirillales bacterium]